MTQESIYVVASERERLVHDDNEHEGRPCEGCRTVHFLYALHLSESEVEACRAAEWSQQKSGTKKGKQIKRGRKTFLSDQRVPLFVSWIPACSWPGTKLRPRTDSSECDAGPYALNARERGSLAAAAKIFAPERAPSHRSRAQRATQPLAESHRRGLVQWIAMFAAMPRQDPMRRIADDLLSRLLRRWTADSAEASAPFGSAPIT